MALSSFFAVRRIARDHYANIIDAHFGYPDGYAAVLLGRWLRLPVMITLRGKEERQAALPSLRRSGEQLLEPINSLLYPAPCKRLHSSSVQTRRVCR